MKLGILSWIGLALLLLLAATRWAEFASGVQTGVLLGAGLLVLVVYPAFLHGFERRIAALERERRG